MSSTVLQPFVFTGESEYGQAQADRAAQNEFIRFLEANPRATINGQPCISTNMLQTYDDRYWHTCTILVLALLPRASREYSSDN